MKMRMFVVGLMMIVAPAFAEETQKIVERKTCEQIKFEIATLSAIENPTADQQQELKQLNQQQRSYCSVKTGGRRAIARSVPSVSASEEAPAPKSDALAEYIANKRSNCDKLNSEMEKIASDTSKADMLAEMQGFYDADCAAHKPAAQIAEAAAVVAPAVPMKTDAEIAAEFDANLAAGLCGDGAKPNKFGCCSGETFKDLGNSVFACCPKTGNECFPPIQ